HCSCSITTQTYCGISTIVYFNMNDWQAQSDLLELDLIQIVVADAVCGDDDDLVT
ncbi:hypothetical protein RDWZM_007550, partial [Blomia tropicalis]